MQVEPSQQAVLRFAPSPNGALHLGHALSALVTYDMAAQLRGKFLLRIEDIDLSRSREEFVTQIYDDLAWLGLKWEIPVLRQSQHFADYMSAAQKLEALGLLYPCFATRAEILAAARPGALDPDGAPIYPGLSKNLDPSEIDRRKAAGQSFAMRLDMERALLLLEERGSCGPLAFTEIDESGQPAAHCR